MVNNLQAYLDERVQLYNQTSFIELDPISIPHPFCSKAIAFLKSNFYNSMHIFLYPYLSKNNKFSSQLEIF